MRSFILALLLTVTLLPLSKGLTQTTAGLDSIPARMRDVIVANEVPGVVTAVATRDSLLRMDAQGWATQITKPLCAWIRSSGSLPCQSLLPLRRCLC
jgi:hypothetical protein